MGTLTDIGIWKRFALFPRQDQNCVVCDVPTCPACPEGQVCSITSRTCLTCPVTFCEDLDGSIVTGVSSSPTASSTVEPTSSGGTNKNAIIGGVVGGVVGLLLLLAGLYFLLKFRRKRTTEIPIHLDTVRPVGGVAGTPTEDTIDKTDSDKISVAESETPSHILSVAYDPNVVVSPEKQVATAAVPEYSPPRMVFNRDITLAIAEEDEEEAEAGFGSATTSKSYKDTTKDVDFTEESKEEVPTTPIESTIHKTSTSAPQLSETLNQRSPQKDIPMTFEILDDPTP